VSTMTATADDVRAAAIRDLRVPPPSSTASFVRAVATRAFTAIPRADRSCAPGASAGRPKSTDAVVSAVHAQQAWRRLDSGRRRDALLSLATVVEAHADALAALVTLEMGMPLRGVAGRRSRRRRLVSALRRLRRQDRGFGPIGRFTGPRTRLHPLLAIRRRRGHHSLERPGDGLGAEGRSSSGSGKLRGAQASELAPFSSLYFGALAVAPTCPPAWSTWSPEDPRWVRDSAQTRLSP